MNIKLIILTDRCAGNSGSWSIHQSIKAVRTLEANPSSLGTGPEVEETSHLWGTFLDIPPSESEL